MGFSGCRARNANQVVVLMQQLTNALETSGEDCGKVEEVLTYYQVPHALNPTGVPRS